MKFKDEERKENKENKVIQEGLQQGF